MWRVFTLFISVLLLTNASCAKIFTSSANPRGWKAAQAFSEDLLAKLELKRGRHRFTPQILGGDSSPTPAAQAVKPGQYEEREPEDGRFLSGYNFQQLALPTLALCLLSALLGWLLRGAEDRLAPGRPNRLLGQQQKPQLVAPAKDVLQTNSTDQETNKAGGAPQATPAASQPETEVAAATAGVPASSSSDSATEAPSHRASSSIRGFSRGLVRKSRGRRTSVKAQRRECGGTSEGGKSVGNECTGMNDCGKDSGFETPTAEAQQLSERTSAARPGPSPGWLKKRSESSPPITPLNEQSAKLGAVDDMTLIMAALAERLSLDVDSMLPQERMQLLQMALQCCQHRESSWLHSQANEIRATHLRTAQDTLQHERDRTEAEDALREMDAFRLSLEDGLLAGLGLMLGTLLACGMRCGYLGSRLGRCRSVASLPSASLLRPWAVLDFLSVLGCWAQATSDALLACCIMLGTAFVVVKGGMLGGSMHAAPQLKLAVGLGVVCGLAGYLAVGRLGGDAGLWLVLWEAWIGMHVVASWQLAAVHRALSCGPWASLRLLLYQGSLSLSLPLMTAILPFDGCFSRVSSVLLSALRD